MKLKNEKSRVILVYLFLILGGILIFTFLFITRFIWWNIWLYEFGGSIILVIIVIVAFYVFLKPKRKPNNKDFSHFSGKGTKFQPFIINSKDYLPSSYKIYRSNAYIIFKELETLSLNLYNCQNIKIGLCKFTRLELHSCSNILVTKSLIDLEIEMIKCHNIELEANKIGKLNIGFSHDNNINNCELNELETYYSNGNIYKKNAIKQKSINDLDESKLMKKKGFFLLLALLAFPLSVTLILIFNSILHSSTLLSIAVYPVAMMTLIIFGVPLLLCSPMIFGLLSDYIQIKKNNNYPPNKCIN